MNSREIYSHDGLQALRRSELNRVQAVLQKIFSQVNPPPGSCADWSMQVEAAGLQVGRIYVCEGGHTGLAVHHSAWDFQVPIVDLCTKTENGLFLCVYMHVLVCVEMSLNLSCGNVHVSL